MKKQLFYKDAQHEITSYTISNDNIEVTAIDYGASITAIRVRDKAGNRENVVASFHNPKDYIDCGGPYLNALVGPYAGRVAYGKYTMDQQVFQLSQNSAPHHLHGGYSGISKKIFHVKYIEDAVYQELRFTLCTNHEQDGYEGDFQYDVSYILYDHTVEIRYRCLPQYKTLLNMTSHLYFNLSGELKDSIMSHQLRIDSEQYLAIHEDGHPYKRSTIQNDDAFDFRTLRSIQTAFDKGHEQFQITRAYDTPYLLSDRKQIQLYHEKSGRSLHIQSDQDAVVVYSANYFDEDMTLNEGRKGYLGCCLALETQDPPNAMNIDELQSNQVFDAKHPYTQRTCYTFTIGDDHESNH